MHATIGAVVQAIEGNYRGLLAEGTGSRPLGRRFVDDAKVSDHHAIIPTTLRAGAALSTNQQRIYDLICRRLLQAWHDDHVYATTRVVTEVSSIHASLGSPIDGGTPTLDRFESNGTAIEHLGWKELDLGGKKPKSTPRRGAPEGDDADEDQKLPPGFRRRWMRACPMRAQ